jgi:hypothetical protein
MPMMTDAVNEKIVRRDIVTVLPRLPKTVVFLEPHQTILDQIAPESRNLPRQRRIPRRCFVDLDQSTGMLIPAAPGGGSMVYWFPTTWCPPRKPSKL